jgi:xylan 1,4-beta-xylosidase
MAWNYHDDDVPGPDAAVRMTLGGIPPAAHRVLLRHYRIDATHSNAYTVWRQMDSPQSPTPEQYTRLEAAGQLELLESPRWVSPEKGTVELNFTLPRQGVSLVQASW